jgi:hypothetical protein
VGVTPPAPIYTHTASASLYEATEAPNESYYVPKPQDDTPDSTPVATTTVFISPLPAPPKVQGEINSTISTATIRTATVTGYGIWTISVGDVGTSAAGGLTGASSGGFGVLTTTATAYLATVTASSTVLVTNSSTINGGYGLPPASTHAQSARLVPRQTCTWVTAERLGGWCNNWDGSTVVSYPTYDTTGNAGRLVHRQI